MKAEHNKYYILENNNIYFCTTIQRRVKFEDLLVVKCGSAFGNNGHLGYIVDTKMHPYGPDYETNSEIEFTDDDIVGEYQLKGIELNYYDFLFNRNDFV